MVPGLEREMEELLTIPILEKMTRYRQKKKEIFEPFRSEFHSEIYFKNIINGRKVLIWSACSKSDWIYEKCVEYDLEIAGYIDSNDSVRQWNDKPVYGTDVLERTSYFVFVALENKYHEVFDTLDEKGYIEFNDFLYPGYLDIVLNHMTNNGTYFDNGMNEVVGEINRFKVCMTRGSRVYIGKNCKIAKDVIFNAGGGLIIIEDNCCIEKGCIIAVNDSILRLGKGCMLQNDSRICCSYNSVLNIDDGCSMETRFSAMMHGYANIYLGKNCMLSTNIFMRAGSVHNIYDLDNKENREVRITREINVGQHVWIGEHCVLLHGVSIGSGSIVGMNSFVNKKFPENVTIAGNPARIIRRNVSWDKSVFPYLLDEDVFRKFDYRTD